MTKLPPIDPLIPSLDPKLAAAWPDMNSLASTHVEHLLIRAVHAGKLSQVGQFICTLDPQTVSSAGRITAAEAVAVCEAIAAHNRDAEQKMVMYLTGAGVTASPRPRHDSRAMKQVHGFDIQITPASLAQALSLAEKDGYWVDSLWSDGAIESLMRTHSKMTLTKNDKVTTRMTLHWRKSRPATRWRSICQPSENDYRLISLPTSLWPLYHLLRPFRLTATYGFGWRQAGDLGHYLGTPATLIPSLLDFAEVTSDDLIFDLGCGDGRVLQEAARLKGCRAVGIEQDSGLVELARKAVVNSSLDHLVDIAPGDILATDLRLASVVFLFLPVEKVADLLPQIRSQLAPGARIIMHEQLPINPALQPDSTKALFADAALTVAHLWRIS